MRFLMTWQPLVGLIGFARARDFFHQPTVEGGKKPTFKKKGLA